jgi:hypothetical protein
MARKLNIYYQFYGIPPRHGLMKLWEISQNKNYSLELKVDAVVIQ